MEIFIGLAALFSLIVIGLLVWSLLWVHRDATERGHENAGLIALLCFICNWPFSLLMYMLMRKKMPFERET